MHIQLISSLEQCHHEALVSSYFNRLQHKPVEARRKGYKPGSSQDLASQLKSRCRPLTRDEMRIAQEVMDRATFIFPSVWETINVVMIRRQHTKPRQATNEMNCSFTLGKTVVLTPAHFPDTLIHEAVHCIQTLYPEMMADLYRRDGWTPVSDRSIENHIHNYTDNPDATLSRPGCAYLYLDKYFFYYGADMHVYVYHRLLKTVDKVSPDTRIEFMNRSVSPNQPHELLAQTVAERVLRGRR